MSSESADQSSSQRTSAKFSIPSCILTNSQPTLLARGESYIRSKLHKLGKCKSRSEERGQWKLSFTILSIKSSLSRSGVATSQPHMQGKHILRSYIKLRTPLAVFLSSTVMPQALFSKTIVWLMCLCLLLGHAISLRLTPRVYVSYMYFDTLVGATSRRYKHA